MKIQSIAQDGYEKIVKCEDPDTGLRASLAANGDMLTFTRYLPADKLITTLLAHRGQTVAELRARYPHIEGTDGVPLLLLPPTEREEDRTYVAVRGKDGKVHELKSRIPYGNQPGVKEELHARLAKAGGDKVRITDVVEARVWQVEIPTP